MHAVPSPAKATKGMRVAGVRASSPAAWEVKESPAHPGKHAPTAIVCQRKSPSSENRADGLNCVRKSTGKRDSVEATVLSWQGTKQNTRTSQRETGPKRKDEEEYTNSLPFMSPYAGTREELLASYLRDYGLEGCHKFQVILPFGPVGRRDRAGAFKNEVMAWEHPDLPAGGECDPCVKENGQFITLPPTGTGDSSSKFPSITIKAFSVVPLGGAPVVLFFNRDDNG
ncbi:hypothetical protein CB1_000764017 [Camelus ferus]|nr:hypothetical protein CB1_000764017 [Camelus ferus]